jgi:carbon-monoxide dehydrogenase medium subunit
MFHFDYHEPGSLPEIIALQSKFGGDAALLAGGTALLIDIKQKKLNPGHLISLWGIPDLSKIRTSNSSIYELGALSTITELLNAFPGSSPYQCLTEASYSFGAHQIQNMATIGGNICKASPGADLVPPLICLDATLHLEGPNGLRLVPIEGFLTAPGRCQLQPAEILTKISLPAQPARTGSAFFKIMRRQALDLSIVSVCARITLAEDGQTILASRISLGAVAPYPIRAKKAEALLNGQKLTPELLYQVGVEACTEASPINDIRASAEYRRQLIETLVPRAVSTAAQRSLTGGFRS